MASASRWLLLTLFLCVSSVAAASAELEIEIDGNQTLTSARILADIEFWLEDLRDAPGDESALIDTAYAIENLYRGFGHPQARVTGQAEGSGDRWRVRFTVTEGPVFVVEDIKVVGNAQYDDDTLEKHFGWRRRGLLETGKQLFGNAELQRGLDAIRIRYQVAGYLDATVEATTQESRKKDRVAVRISLQVTEGPRYVVQSLTLGTAAQTPEALLLRVAGVGAGAVYSRRLPVEVESRVEQFLRNRGFFDPVVAVEATRVGPAAFALELQVIEGNEVTLGAVDITGLQQVNRGWIDERLEFAAGDAYSVYLLDAARRRLLRSGLFESVTISATPSPDDASEVFVTVELAEKDRIRLSTQLGFGSYELGRVGVELYHRNLFGRALEGRLRGKGSFRGEEVAGNLRYPFRTDYPVALTLLGRYRRFEEVSFERQEIEMSTGVEVALKERAIVSVGYTLRDEQIHDPEPTVPTTLLDDSRAALLFGNIQRDRRDSVLDPSRGYIASLRTEYATEELGSELSFVRLKARFTGIIELHEGWTLIGSMRAGYLRPLQSEIIPLGERFYLGGARSVRSFRQDGVGPKDASDNPIGGEAFTLANLELRFPIWKQLGGTAFVDAGSVHADHNDFTRSDYRYAAGGGFLLNTPIGPFRVDAAGTLNREAGEDSWAIHVLLGHPF
ncbi:MAG: BamA/TamA family outer membrane protein [Planctomycetota bacterium]